MSSVWAVSVCVCACVCLCFSGKISSASRVKRRQPGAQQNSVATRFIGENENENEKKNTLLIIKYKCENVLKHNNNNN